MGKHKAQEKLKHSKALRISRQHVAAEVTRLKVWKTSGFFRGFEPRYLGCYRYFTPPQPGFRDTASEDWTRTPGVQSAVMPSSLAQESNKRKSA
jgi:hypothetical protein